MKKLLLVFIISVISLGFAADLSQPVTRKDFVKMWCSSLGLITSGITAELKNNKIIVIVKVAKKNSAQDFELKTKTIKMIFDQNKATFDWFKDIPIEYKKEVIKTESKK